MARFLITTTPFPAHLDWGGLLATAKCLHRAGHDVLWLTGSRMIPLLRRDGTEAWPIPTVDPHRDGTIRESLGPAGDRSTVLSTWHAAFRAPRNSDTPLPHALVRPYAFLVRLLAQFWLDEEAMERCCDAIGVIVDDWQPDVIVAEPFMLPAALVAEARGVRLASCGYSGPLLTLQPLPELEKVAHRVCDTCTRLRCRLGLSAVAPRLDVEVFFAASDLQIVYFPPDWYGDLSGRVSPGVQFVGSTSNLNRPERGRDEEGSTARRPLIVMAAASSYSPDLRVVRAMFDAVERVGGVGLFGGCPELRPLFEPLPPEHPMGIVGPP